MSNPKPNNRECKVAVIVSKVLGAGVVVDSSCAPDFLHIESGDSLCSALEKLYEAGFVLQHADEASNRVADNLGIQYTFVKCKSNHNCWC